MRLCLTIWTAPCRAVRCAAAAAGHRGGGLGAAAAARLRLRHCRAPAHCRCPENPCCNADYGFDPLGLSSEPGQLAWNVQAELIHARLAMMGCAGVLFTSVRRASRDALRMSVVHYASGVQSGAAGKMSGRRCSAWGGAWPRRAGPAPPRRAPARPPPPAPVAAGPPQRQRHS